MEKLSMDQLNRVDVSTYKSQSKNGVVVILDDVRSALNVGAIFRTADAFAIEKVILCGITSTPPNREITKTALGATESVDWEYFEDTVSALLNYKELGYEIVAVEQTSEAVSLETYDYKHKKICLIFGNEVEGVKSEVLHHCTRSIVIPQQGTKHSLNVSVCAGIVLWVLTRE
jgi:tRNA G18 (ribose-2'-O)-methylase SpoU